MVHNMVPDVQVNVVPLPFLKVIQFEQMLHVCSSCVACCA